MERDWRRRFSLCDGDFLLREKRERERERERIGKREKSITRRLSFLVMEKFMSQERERERQWEKKRRARREESEGRRFSLFYSFFFLLHIAH